VPPLVIFDLDGTLTDSAPGMVNCLRFALDSLDLECPPEETIRTFLGPPLAVTFRTHFGMDEALSAQAIAKYRERYHDIGLFENEVYPGVPELLQSLQDSSFVLATATSKPTVSATRILEHFDLAQHFTFIGGATLDGTRDAKTLVVRHTLDACAPHEALVMVGDREHDVHGARDHGIPTIGVTWGYGSDDELREAGAAVIVDAPGDVAIQVLQLQETGHLGSSDRAGPTRA
jgi:phosphoglycolate phosphatase